MWWHTVTLGRGSEGETEKWSGEPVLFTLPRNMVYPALLPLMRTPRLPAFDWTDASRRFKWTRPFHLQTKSGFCACAITFQPASTSHYSLLLPHLLLLFITATNSAIFFHELRKIHNGKQLFLPSSDPIHNLISLLTRQALYSQTPIQRHFCSF